MDLVRMHEWRQGFGKDLEWLIDLADLIDLIGDMTARHARDAHKKGIPPEEHIRNVLAVPG